MSAKEPLILLHGFSGSTVMWDPVLEPLSEHHELHVMPLAGHAGGELLADGIAYSVGTLADDLEARMDAAGLETAHVCGNSLGGWLALELGVRGRARSVVAVAPAGGWEGGQPRGAPAAPLLRPAVPAGALRRPARRPDRPQCADAAPHA